MTYEAERESRLKFMKELAENSNSKKIACIRVPNEAYPHNKQNVIEHAREDAKKLNNRMSTALKKMLNPCKE